MAGTPLDPASETVYLGLTTGMCRECRQLVQARYVADEGGVYLERMCPTHGSSRALVAEHLSWFIEALQSPAADAPPPQTHPKRLGCPMDCGPCSFHAQACHLPVFSITNACNLRCPICFTYNRADQRYFMSAEEFTRQLDYVVDATGGVDLVNITGGEPTLHPEIFGLLELAKRPKIGRVTMNTNGLTIARDPDVARRLADLGTYAILSLDTLDSDRSRRIHGRDIVDDKRRALDNLEKHDVQTTLLMVLIGGVNEDELGTLLDLMVSRPNVRSLTIQTMTYTGQGGGDFLPRVHLPVEGVERRIAEASGSTLGVEHFIPLPTAHALCYGVCYLLVADDGTLHPLTALLGKEILSGHLADGYLLRPTDSLEQDLRTAIDEAWSEGRSPEILAAIKQMLTTLYPSDRTLTIHERQRLAESLVKTIYVHAHMDEDTWEVGRAMRCPDQVPVDAERLIGACNYNLFYRMKDPRFFEVVE